MKILITGASGYLGREIVRQILLQGRHTVVAATSDVERAKSVLPADKIALVKNDDLLAQRHPFKGTDFVIHCAFCRASDGKRLIESLHMTQRFADLAVQAGVKGFLNMSSQAVYGTAPGALPTESGELNPEYLYAFAKCSAEMLLESLMRGKGASMKCVNIRLASLMGPSGSVPVNVLYKFLQSGLEGKDFCVVGGRQQFSFLDVRDAAEAILRLVESDVDKWETIYNLGPELQINILEMADMVCEKVRVYTGNTVKYDYRPDNTALNAGMNSEKLYAYLNWHPRHSFEAIVEDTLKYMIAKKGRN